MIAIIVSIIVSLLVPQRLIAQEPQSTTPCTKADTGVPVIHDYGDQSYYHEGVVSGHWAAFVSTGAQKDYLVAGNFCLYYEEGTGYRRASFPDSTSRQDIGSVHKDGWPKPATAVSLVPADGGSKFVAFPGGQQLQANVSDAGRQICFNLTTEGYEKLGRYLVDRIVRAEMWQTETDSNKPQKWFVLLFDSEARPYPAFGEAACLPPSVDPTPTQPVDPTPVPTQPVDPTPVPTKPVDPTPVPTKPVDPTPAPTKPVDPTLCQYNFHEIPLGDHSVVQLWEPGAVYPSAYVLISVRLGEKDLAFLLRLWQYDEALQPNERLHLCLLKDENGQWAVFSDGSKELQLYSLPDWVWEEHTDGRASFGTKDQVFKWSFKSQTWFIEITIDQVVYYFRVDDPKAVQHPLNWFWRPVYLYKDGIWYLVLRDKTLIAQGKEKDFYYILYLPVIED